MSVSCRSIYQSVSVDVYLSPSISFQSMALTSLVRRSTRVNRQEREVEVEEQKPDRQKEIACQLMEMPLWKIAVCRVRDEASNANGEGKCRRAILCTAPGGTDKQINKQRRKCWDIWYTVPVFKRKSSSKRSDWRYVSLSVRCLPTFSGLLVSKWENEPANGLVQHPSRKIRVWLSWSMGELCRQCWF